MRSITVTILYALIAQAPAKDLLANIDSEELANKFIDKLIDRLSGTPLDDADLDKTTLAKSSPGSTHGSSISLYQPVLSRGVTRFQQPFVRSMQNQPMLSRGVTRFAQPSNAYEPDRSEMMKDLPQTSPVKLDGKDIAKTIGVAAAAGLAPLATQAEVTPSLKNLLSSVVAGGFVVAAIAGAVVAVSNFDPVDRA